MYNRLRIIILLLTLTLGFFAFYGAEYRAFDTPESVEVCPDPEFEWLGPMVVVSADDDAGVSECPEPVVCPQLPAPPTVENLCKGFCAFYDAEYRSVSVSCMCDHKDGFIMIEEIDTIRQRYNKGYYGTNK